MISIVQALHMQSHFFLLFLILFVAIRNYSLLRMQYFDIHSHLYFPDYDTDREEVITRMKNEGIWTTAIGADLESSKKAIALAEKHENIFASVGQHPEHSANSKESISYDISKEMEKLIEHPKVVAIGECGFDFYRTEKEDLEKIKEDQKEIFEKQIDLAVKNNKALMLHCRPSKGSMDAYEETLSILEPLAKKYGNKLFGNAHFFVGDLEILRRFLDIGFTVSFTGVITFAQDYDELVRFAPLNMIHAETDAPFVAPLSHRGKRNSPEYVYEVVVAIARLKEESIHEVKSILVSNAKKLFGIV